MFWAGHEFTARSRCDLDLQGRDPNVARDTLSQHGGHFCKFVTKSHFKERSYGPDTNGTYGQGDDYMLPRNFSGSIKTASICGYLKNSEQSDAPIVSEVV